MISAAFSSWALQVTSTSGNLCNLVDDNTITQLSISGNMDARDFKFIADNLNNLASLNLSNVHIDAVQTQKPMFMTLTSYEEQTIPATAFFGKKLRNLALPREIKAIGMAAFAGCEQIESILLPETLEVIGPYAFSACNACKQVTLPAGIKEIGEGAFSRCANLKSVTINPTNDFVVAKDAFQDCKLLSSVTLGENVTAIGPGAFSGCTALRTPVIASSNKLEAIAEAAFASSAIESVALENCTNLKTIGMWAFANTMLKDVVLPESLESIGDGAFYYNTSMEQIDIPANITNLSKYLLAGNNATSDLPLKEGVTSIGDYAFYNWDQVKEFIFPESVEYVGTKAMAGQVGLEKVTANPLAVPELGDSVWAGVDQPSIPLIADASVVEDYKAAAQWKEFAIISTPTDINNVTADKGNDVKAFFSATILNVKATTGIKHVAIFDPSGILLSAVTPDGNNAQLDTSAFYGKLYIVNVVLDDGTNRTFKLLRK